VNSLLDIAVKNMPRTARRITEVAMAHANDGTIFDACQSILILFRIGISLFRQFIDFLFPFFKFFYLLFVFSKQQFLKFKDSLTHKQNLPLHNPSGFRWKKSPPTSTASRKVPADIAIASFHPNSLAKIATVAIQGT